MSATYTNTIIVNCNRAQSVEAQSGNDENLASFTNTVGSGVRLDVGDQVEIQSTYISEIGAGADTIEFKGHVLRDNLGQPITKKYKYTKRTNKYPVQNEKSVYIKDDDELRQHNSKALDYYQSEYTQEETDETPLKDNEATISINYYKNADGHGYMFLPRNGYQQRNNSDNGYGDKDLTDMGNQYILPLSLIHI